MTQQLPLPNPDALPAWVHAALDEWHTSRALFRGLDVLKQQYEDLNKPHHLEQIERQAFKRLYWLACIWQSANFRTFITSFEQDLLKAEIDVIHGNPLATRLMRDEYTIANPDGSNHRVIDEYHVLDWPYIIPKIQKRLGSWGVIMGYHQIRAMLETIDAIYYVCDQLELDVQAVSNQKLHHTLRKAA
jgi:hypothetical protein